MYQKELVCANLMCFDLDGKSFRGSRKHGSQTGHLLAGLRQRLGITLSQVAVSDTTNEIGVVLDLLQLLMPRR